MADTRPTIKKFTGVDFDVWEMSLRALLTIHQVSHVLHKAPTKMTTKEVDAWEKAQNLAFSHALLTLDEVHKRKVSKSKTVVEILAILRSEYQSITTANKHYLKKQLSRLTMEEGISMPSHLSNFKNLLSQLERIGCKVANDDAVLALFNSLPPAFDAIIKPLEVMENITLEKAKQALFNEELLQKQKSDNLSDALFASKGGRGRPTHNFNHRVICNHCKKKGHKASACFILHPELKCIPRKPQHNTHASESGKSGDNNNTHKNNNTKYNNNNSKNKQNIKEDFVAVACALMADVTDGNWYLDSGASNHMCTEKSA